MILEAAQRLTASNPEPLHFIDHVTSEHWLEGKRKYIASRPRSHYNVPVMDSITGEFSRIVLLPTSVMARFKGQAGEHYNVRHDDLNWLANYMQTHKRLPQNDAGRDMVPNIMVDFEGTPWINEGNHRIKAARQIGIKALPVRIVYFDGGERESKTLSPDWVKRADAEAHRLGFTFENYATHKPNI